MELTEILSWALDGKCQRSAIRRTKIGSTIKTKFPLKLLPLYVPQTWGRT
jgi:hypothetical protein